MSSVLPYLLIWLQEYGYPLLWVTVFVSAAGIPLPTSLVLLAAGAFAASGDFNLLILIIVASTAFIAGDNVGYLLGHLWGSKLLEWLEKSGKMRIIKPRAIIRSRIYFNRLGGWAIFFSRFLASALGGTINILAGAERYPYRRFVFYDACGEAVGAALPLVLGYIFGASWDSVGDILGSFSLFLLATLVFLWLAFKAFYIVKRMRKSPESVIDPLSARVVELTMVATPLPHTDTAEPSSDHLPL